MEESLGDLIRAYEEIRTRHLNLISSNDGTISFVLEEGLGENGPTATWCVTIRNSNYVYRIRREIRGEVYASRYDQHRNTLDVNSSPGFTISDAVAQVFEWAKDDRR